MSSSAAGATIPMPRSNRSRSARIRRGSETAIISSLVLCSLFTVLVTGSIIGILLLQTIKFFQLPDVSIREYFLGTTWAPLLGQEKHFGVWPLVSATLSVAVISACVSIPLGTITAIYLSEYAPKVVRAIVKPVLEVLAGIPTVVYGFFALFVITPSLQWLHDGFEVYNIMSGGIAVGIMCIPIVSSLSEDALQAVPRSLREGAFAVGGTKFDVSVKVVFPAALSGITAAYLLAIARAVGETMIVALAAGNLAQLTLDPREGAQTMTAYMVQIFLGDVSNFGPEYFSSYAVAATLFAITLVLTIIGSRILKHFREEYE